MYRSLPILLGLLFTETFAIELPDVSECKKSEHEYWTPLLCALEKNGLERLEKSCGTPLDYKKLFELSNHVGGGASSIEIYAEVNEKAILACPEGYFDALLAEDEKMQASTLKHVPTVTPPWEFAEAIYKYVNDKRYGDFLNKKYKFLLEKCVNKEGEAIEGCL
jgi:hypothetical protein